MCVYNVFTAGMSVAVIYACKPAVYSLTSPPPSSDVLARIMSNHNGHDSYFPPSSQQQQQQHDDRTTTTAQFIMDTTPLSLQLNLARGGGGGGGGEEGLYGTQVMEIDDEEDIEVKYMPALLHSSNSPVPVAACKVCEDQATGMYFGALVCVPCKVGYRDVLWSSCLCALQGRLQGCTLEL